MVQQTGIWLGIECYILHYIKDYISNDRYTVYGINQCPVYPKITGTTPCCVLDGNLYTPTYGKHWISFYDSTGSGGTGNVVVEYTIINSTTINIWILSNSHSFTHRIYWNDELLWSGTNTSQIFHLVYSGTKSIYCPYISYQVIAKYMTTNGHRESDTCIWLMSSSAYAQYTTYYPYNYVVFKTCHSDWNDGVAKIYINDVLVDRVNTYNAGTIYCGPYSMTSSPTTVKVTSPYAGDNSGHVQAGSFIFFNDASFNYTIY